MKASHFLVRQESGKEAPGPSVPLKNTNSNANNWRICVFLTRHSDGPGTPTANEVAFSVARETARMTFARSHAARVPENGIWNRAANRAPAVAGEIISAQRLSARTRCEMLACVQARNPIAPGAIPNIIFRRIRRMRAHECHSYCFVCVRKMPQLRRLGGPGGIGASRMKKYEFASCWHWNSYFLGERNPPGSLLLS